ncbi:MAG: 3-dehydro-bile acid delta(4,6)-reductase [Chlamydiia bacterium]|nr:3-dehydro-bile acid delta(4,6)-reductase [Chlamydiia bacterium]MCH9615264.1 3-dehydro-bile acid delta(4,6)-reductase [Chlamydiia bacterium]MCH9628414.1 3-dehydro-bile acid delta(4,6)-reductase [Chlamydiia bacterium]
MRIVIVGGGAAGFFAALHAKEIHPQAEVMILERGIKLLSKVKISGGGRCNVTHHCFQPKELVQNYPRGSRELLGPFHTFGPEDTIAWFEKRGVKLKTEADGRMFPVTNSSETIIACFLKEADRLGVRILTQHKLQGVKVCDEGFELEIASGQSIKVERLIMATGSAKPCWEFLAGLGHTIEPPVPSLFAFNIPSHPLVELSGVAVPARVSIEGSRLKQEGPLLITHQGFSGPAALKLSAFGARFLAEKNYESTLVVDWLPGILAEEIRHCLQKEQGNKPIVLLRCFDLPKKLWKTLCLRAGIAEDLVVNSLGKKGLSALCCTLKEDRYEMKGKTTNKDEFVTCGGVRLSEVNFKTMESKVQKGLFFCGEILDIDGVTGGFNFQNAWTTGFIAGGNDA